MSELTGQTIGQYSLVQKLGGGGMAEVYKAYQSQLDRHVAIKFIRPELAGDGNFQARFSQEAKAIARLSHGNIVHVYDFGQSGHRYYLVMEYIDGNTLSDYLSSWYASGKGIPVNQAFSIIQQIGNALDYAHQQGIIHRDIKPDNILITPNGRVVLTDFGIAKIIETTQGLTRTGMAMGTPAYMAPEQIEGDKNKIGPASDIYSLGIILYQMATGKPPFTGNTPMHVMLKHLSEPIPPPRTVNPQLPQPVEQVILNALAKEPAHRYQNAQHMLFDFQQAIASSPGWTEMRKPFNGSSQANRVEGPISEQKWDSFDQQPPTSGEPWRSSSQPPTLEKPSYESSLLGEKTVQVIGFGRRAVAYLIDTILLAIVGGIVGAFTGFTIGVGSVATGASSDTTMSVAELVAQCLGLLINGAYFVIFWSQTGQTIGKMAMGIKVVDTNGQLISGGKAIARYVGYFISSLVLAFGFAWVAFDEKRQGWHDKIANTYVVRQDVSFSSTDQVTFVPSDPGNSGLIIVLLLYGITIFSCVAFVFLVAQAAN